MKKNSTSDGPDGRVAFLWDESFLWGVMAIHALRSNGLPFELIRSEDIRNGRLHDVPALFVPGGWASNKLKALGDDGAEHIRRYVEGGGMYIGFCGGAGLATQEGIGLVPVRRLPTKERVPSFSGRIKLSLSASPLWQGIDEPVFHAWWPSQFVVDGDVDVLASYEKALPDSFSSDVNVGDAEAVSGWRELEEIYQINLDPKRLAGSPALISGAFGKGTVLLSLIHFDTPGDPNGARILRNIWTSVGVHATPPGREDRAVSAAREPVLPVDRDLDEIMREVNELIELGIRNYLWFWRLPMLLQWRRGVRGLEYCTLVVMMRELAAVRRKRDWPAGYGADPGRLRSMTKVFTAKARELLVRERLAMHRSHITYEKCDDPSISTLREELFSRSKSHGGLFKELIDEIDRLLFPLLRLAGDGSLHGTPSARTDVETGKDPERKQA